MAVSAMWCDRFGTGRVDGSKLRHRAGVLTVSRMGVYSRHTVADWWWRALQTPWWTTVVGALLGYPHCTPLNAPSLRLTLHRARFCSKAVAEGSPEGYPVFGAICAAQYFRQASDSRSSNIFLA